MESRWNGKREISPPPPFCINPSFIYSYRFFFPPSLEGLQTKRHLTRKNFFSVSLSCFSWIAKVFYWFFVRLHLRWIFFDQNCLINKSFVSWNRWKWRKIDSRNGVYMEVVYASWTFELNTIMCLWLHASRGRLMSVNEDKKWLERHKNYLA